jgi:hypothetical protein
LWRWASQLLSIGFRILVSRHPAIQATGPLTLTPAGLSPAEHASLRWTHNRTWVLLHSAPSRGHPTRNGVEIVPLPHRLQAPCVRLGARSSRAGPRGRTATPWGGEPLTQPLTRSCCETPEFGCHGQSPLCGGPCLVLTFSSAATPLLDPHYRASSLLCMAPTSSDHRRCPCFHTCSSVPASSGPSVGSPWLPRALNVRLDMASDPGEHPAHSPWRTRHCGLPEGQARRRSR